MTNTLQVYSNENFRVRTTQDADGTVWFVARDIAEALEYSDASIDSVNKLMSIVPEIWSARKRFLVRSENGIEQSREMLCLTEQGVYFFLGRLPKASIPCLLAILQVIEQEKQAYAVRQHLTRKG